MNSQEFDNQFREKLGHFRSPVNPEAVWAGVQSKMSSGRDRMSGIWLALGIALFLLIAGVSWLALEDINLAEPTRSYNPRSAEIVYPLSYLEPVDARYKESLINLDGNGLTTDEKPSESSNDFIALLKNDEHQNMAGNAQDDSSTLQSSSDIAANEGFTIPVPSAENMDAENDQSELAFFEKSYPAGFSPVIPVTKGMESNISNSYILPIQATAITMERPTPVPAEGKELLTKKSLIRSTSLSLLTDGGAGIAARNIESSNQTWEEFTAQRQRTELPLEFISAQIRFSLELPGKWYFTSGLLFTQVNEQFNLNRSTTNQEALTYISDVYIDESGESTLVYNTGTITTQKNEELVHINRYRFLDIPLTAGYNHRMGRWNLAAEAGLLVNVQSNSTGSMLNHEAAVVRIEDSGMFRRQMGLGYTGSLRLGYQLGIRSMVYIQPVFRWNPDSVTDQSVQLQTYALYGLNAGLAMRLW